MSQDTALLLAIVLMAGGPPIATALGIPAGAQIVAFCAGFLCMARALRFVTPLAIVAAALLALALTPFVKPSRDTLELIVVATVSACVTPAVLHDPRRWGRRSL